MGKYDFAFDLYEDSPLAWIARTVESGSTVLEFGSANGRLTKYLHTEKNCVVDIVEIDESSGSEASLYASHSFLGTENGDIEKYYWVRSDVQYDYVIFADVLEHLYHPQEVLNRCKSVIKPEGKILVSVPNVSHNSVLIELFNDRFHYTPTGLLDDTHIRFFTRQSFIEMAGKAGWAVITEYANYIRVGENEIPNSYRDVPKEVYKALINRDSGNVYQYMFILSLSKNYIKGNCERLISLDASSCCYTEVLYEYNGDFDYKHSINKYINPNKKEIFLSFPVLANSLKAKINLLNCNAILQINSINICSGMDKYSVKEFKHNGVFINEVYFFINEAPELYVPLCVNAEKLEMSLNIIKYDFEDPVYPSLLSINASLQHQNFDLLQKLQGCEQTIQAKNQELQESSKSYAQLLQKKESELAESIKSYQDIIRRNQFSLQERKSTFSQIPEKEKQKLQENAMKLSLIRKIFRSLPLPETLKNKIRIKLHLLSGRRHKNLISIYGQNECNPPYKGPVKKVTAVIPNYNYARYLNERIDSILFQTYPVQEIIVLDDASTDESVSLIEERIRYNKSGIKMSLIRNPENSGNVFCQWQKAFESSDNEYVWIAEADDSCDSRFLETVMQGFNDQDVVISYCESLTIDEYNMLLMPNLREWIDIFKCGKWNQNYVKSGTDEVSETMCINNTIANVSSVIFKNGDYHQVLEAAKSFHLAGDWYTYMNILKMGKIAYFKDSYNYHRMHTQGVTLSTSSQKEYEEIVRIQDYAIENFKISDETMHKMNQRREEVRIRLGV